MVSKFGGTEKKTKIKQFIKYQYMYSLSVIM